MSETENTPQEQVARFREDIARVKAEVGKMIVGQDEIVDGVLTCLLAGGQALLEGVPGLGKTMLVRTLAGVLRLDFSRIQFTPDLMPADIIGTTVLTEGEGGKTRLEFRPGPVFANIVLADEVNRATPKTQSAMLEVMQEHSVTVSNRTHKLEEPYFVLATQNPLEMEGTYYLRELKKAMHLGVIPNDIDMRFVYYISDVPLATGESLAGAMLPEEGIPPLYAITREILASVIKGSLHHEEPSTLQDPENASQTS